MSHVRWRELPQEKRDYIWVYGWGALTFLAFLFLTPETVTNFIGWIAVFSLAVAAIVGGVAAAIGMLIGDNLTTERFGVRVLIWAPILYTLIQLATAIYEVTTINGSSQRWYLVFLGLWPVFFLRKRQHQLAARVKVAKETPLPHETAE